MEHFTYGVTLRESLIINITYSICNFILTRSCQALKVIKTQKITQRFLANSGHLIITIQLELIPL